MIAEDGINAIYRITGKKCHDHYYGYHTEDEGIVDDLKPLNDFLILILYLQCLSYEVGTDHCTE